MMELFSEKVILTKVKAMYGRRVKKEDFEQLLHKTNVPACAAYLKGQTHYERVMHDVQETQIHRGSLEALLHHETLERCARLARYGGRGNQFFRSYYIAELEIRCIVNCVRFMETDNQNEFIRSVPSSLPRYASFDVLALGAVRRFSGLLSALSKTRYRKPLEKLGIKDGQEIDISRVEHELYQFYYSWVSELIETLFSGSTRAELSELFVAQAELYNICAEYRMKSYFNAPRDVVSRFLLDYRGGLNRRTRHELLEAADGERVVEILSHTKYHSYFDKNSFSHIEFSTGCIKFDLAKKYIVFSQNPAVVFAAFVLLQNIEIENLVNIIEGLRYGLDISQIRPLLINGGD